jgi:hypothetical protein
MFEHLPASTRVLLFIGAGIAFAAALAPLPFFDKADVASSGAAPAERAPAEHALVNGAAAAEIRLEDGKTYKAEVVTTDPNALRWALPSTTELRDRFGACAARCSRSGSAPGQQAAGAEG